MELAGESDNTPAPADSLAAIFQRRGIALFIPWRGGAEPRAIYSASRRCRSAAAADFVSAFVRAAGAAAGGSVRQHPGRNHTDTSSSGLTRCHFSAARDRALYPLARGRRAARHTQREPPMPVSGCRRFRFRVRAGRPRGSWRVTPVETTPTLATDAAHSGAAFAFRVRDQPEVVRPNREKARLSATPRLAVSLLIGNCLAKSVC